MSQVFAPPVSAADVWAAATRTLTSGGLTFTSVGASVSVPASSILDLRPVVGNFRRITVGTGTSSATDRGTGVYDGVTFVEMGNSGTSPSRITASGVGNSVRGISFQNSSVAAVIIQWTGFDQS